MKILNKLMDRKKIYFLLKDMPGWLTFKEGYQLYSLAYETKGPVLEIGSYVGRSTLCIAQGIKDSGVDKKFISTDLDLTIKNFKKVGKRVDMFYPQDSKKPYSSIDFEIYKPTEPILLKGIQVVLKQNLLKKDLLKFVTIKKGDFHNVAPKIKYKFIFCDTTHNKHEIDLNAPAIKELLAKNSILTCHDINDELKEYLESYIPVKRSFIVDELYVGFL